MITMKTIIRLLTALCLILALLWGAILISTSERAAGFFELAHKKVEEHGFIEKTKDKLARTMSQIDRPASEPIITEELTEDKPAEINPVAELNPQTPVPEIETEINESKPQEYDDAPDDLFSEEGDSFVPTEQNDVLSASDAIRILETLNIERE